VSYVNFITQTYDQFSVIGTMSVNDKVKIIRKTSCQWQDCAHWRKRKDIKLRDGDTGTLTSLKPGDAVKIKFVSGGMMAKYF